MNRKGQFQGEKNDVGKWDAMNLRRLSCYTWRETTPVFLVRVPRRKYVASIVLQNIFAPVRDENFCSFFLKKLQCGEKNRLTTTHTKYGLPELSSAYSL